MCIFRNALPFLFHSEEDEFTASWSNPEKFTEIIVSHNMLGHHFPDALLDALNYLRDNPDTRTSELFEQGDYKQEPSTSVTDIEGDIT